MGTVFGKLDTIKACRFLNKLAPGNWKLFTSAEILFELVPSPNQTCQLFAEEMIPLLISPNETIALSALSFLDSTLEKADKPNQLAFVETEFFRSLPLSFYEQENHLKSQHKYHLAKIIARYLFGLLRSLDWANAAVIEAQMPTIRTIFSGLLVPLEGWLTDRKSVMPEVRTRSKDILASLNEEGHDDCLEAESRLSQTEMVAQWHNIKGNIAGVHSSQGTMNRASRPATPSPKQEITQRAEVDVEQAQRSNNPSSDSDSEDILDSSDESEEEIV
ncbi:hypothetical protein BLNAU_7483 [Blattamonas nauphoetae]|uniref:Uncharacterized protein n=1 Tax=Blattamonas nauphoetae TaxID=2049346 RepID=A0ABQ9Y1H0_9EUKA|nr:hypothetical protein BLNAU_7483 [Blattamonas nauphoetae]